MQEPFSVPTSCIVVSRYVRSKAQTRRRWGPFGGLGYEALMQWSFSSKVVASGDIIMGRDHPRSFARVPLNWLFSIQRSPKNWRLLAFAPKEANSAPASRRSCLSESGPKCCSQGDKTKIPWVYHGIHSVSTERNWFGPYRLCKPKTLLATTSGTKCNCSNIIFIHYITSYPINKYLST